MDTVQTIDALRVALAGGDLWTVEMFLSERATLHIPGTTGVSGPYQGRQAILRLWDKLAGPTDGGVRFHTERTMHDTDLAALVGHATRQRPDHCRQTPAVLLVGLDAGHITEIRVFHHDRPGLDGLC